MNLKPLLDLIQTEISNQKSNFFITASRPIQPNEEGYEDFHEAEIIREEFRNIVDFVMENHFVNQNKLKIVNEMLEKEVENYSVEVVMNNLGVHGFEDFFIIKGIYVKNMLRCKMQMDHNLY